MPYNPAVAAGVNASPVNLGSALNTIFGLEMVQAHTGLYNLQALQQAREYNALQSAAGAMRNGGNAAQVYVGAGGQNPGYINALQNYGPTQTAIGRAGGVLPNQALDLSKTNQTNALTQNTNLDLQSKIAGGVIASHGADDGAWANAVNAHYQTFGGSDLERQHVLSIKDPQERMRIAQAYSGQGVSPNTVNELHNYAPGENVTTLGAASAPQQPASPAPPGGPQPPAGTQGQNVIQGTTPFQKTFQQEQAKSTIDYLQKDGNKMYTNAQSLLGRMATVDHNIDALGPQWMGAGADAKATMAKGWNSMLDTFGVQGGHFDPNKVATWEEFNKEQIRAGMELINSNFGGSREAASIIQMGKTAVAGVQNTYLGAKYVSSTIKAAAQRQVDLYEYQAQHPDQLPAQSAIQFNKMHPPQQYSMGAIASVIPEGAKQFLAAHPETGAQFNKQFGSGMAQFILGTAK